MLLVAAGCSSSGEDVARQGLDDDDAPPMDDDNDDADDDTGDDDTSGDDDDDNDDDTAVPDFVLISHGTFLMGSPESEPGRVLNETQHQVTLTRDFMIMTTEMTQVRFEELMGRNPSAYPLGDFYPVDSASWYDTVACANQLSLEESYASCYELNDVICIDSTAVGTDYMSCMNHGGIYSATIALNGVSSVYDCEGYRLPTEAEWEYAARAGTTTAYHDGLESDDSHLDCEVPFHLENIAWYCGNSVGDLFLEPHPIATKTPNAWALYDMSGNAWEWTWDWYTDDLSGDATDPEGAADGSDRVVRGGGWNHHAYACRSATRTYDDPGANTCFATGFRFVRTVQ